MSVFTLNETKEALIKLYPLRIPVLLNGASGVGKTSIVKEVANELKMPVVDIRLSTELPENIGGIPIPIDDEKDYFKKILNRDLSPVFEEGAVLFFDELNRSTGWVRNAIMSAFFERMIGGKKLHEKTYVIGAINRGFEYRDVEKLDKALLARFAIINVATRVEEVMDYFSDKYSIATSIFNAKLQVLSNKIYEENRFDELIPALTYRNLEFAAKVIETYYNDPFLRKLLYAVIPPNIADVILADFDFVLVRKVLDGEEVDVGEETASVILAIISGMPISDTEFVNALRFAKRIYDKLGIKDGVIGFLISVAKKNKELFIRQIATINKEFPEIKKAIVF
jgi:hypothetical protein